MQCISFVKKYLFNSICPINNSIINNFSLSSKKLHSPPRLFACVVFSWRMPWSMFPFSDTYKLLKQAWKIWNYCGDFPSCTATNVIKQL